MPRTSIRPLLAASGVTTVPVCLEPLAARLIERLGFPAAYLGGGALGFSLAVSEALLTTTEVAGAARRITQRSNVALIVDGGVGFGDAVHAARAVAEIEAAGAAAIELEDQVAPKRAHHHRGHEHLVDTETMVGKLEAAVAARRDAEFVIIARTSAVRHEGIDAAIERSRAYRAAGADAILLAPRDEAELAHAGREIGAPLVMMSLAGRWPAHLLEAAGARLVIDPFSGQVVMYRALRDALAAMRERGTAGDEADALMALYRELQEVAGMEELYAVERRTTERDAPR
ncbi:MAG: carboxyvinyl-carboxyphosphonate phosphorylmutase [Chloroflexi bacterium]|nr:carboxyvinyl-carboxyphosphonate phosphorylmutase [Chloroflexota bacterium]